MKEKPTQSIWQQQPLYLLLLPVFFVFNGYVENYNFIPVKDALLLLLVYISASLVVTALLWIIYRRLSKAALLSWYLMGFYFFFGYIYDNLYKQFPRAFVSKYSTIIGFFLLFFLIAGVVLFRHKGRLSKLTYALNVFFICLLVVDLVWLSVKIVSDKKPLESQLSKNFIPCTNCDKPDVYLIVADEYAGDQQLKETMNYDNSGFKEELRKRGFYTPVSHSNYNFTPFSVSSMLQMEYLKNIVGKNMDHNDFSVCYGLIRENNVFRFLSANGYRLHNYSIFDIHDQPSVFETSVLPEKTRFITGQTLFNRVEKNMLSNMANRLGTKIKMKHLLLSYNSNRKAIDSVKAVVQKKETAPKFVYTHLMMPHFPYYFTRTGLLRPVQEYEDGNEADIPKYLEYVEYTNQVLLSIIDQVLQHSAKPPVIILVSDHGFREYNYAADSRYYFMNQLCIYLPNKNYQPFYNGLSNVNLFRILFNTQFRQKLPLLVDSTHYINP